MQEWRLSTVDAHRLLLRLKQPRFHAEGGGDLRNIKSNGLLFSTWSPEMLAQDNLVSSGFLPRFEAR